MPIPKEEIAGIKRKLNRMGFLFKRKLEKDIYFTSDFRDFIKTRGGYFVEIESMSIEKGKDKALAENRMIIELLGIGHRVPVDEPYRDIALRNLGR